MSGFTDEKTLILLNPQAGRQRAAIRFREHVRQLPCDVPIIETASAADARSRAREAASKGYAIVAAAGGDGTVHEVACGILESGEEAILGVIPIGSANDFAWSLQHHLGNPASSHSSTDYPCSELWSFGRVDVGKVEIGEEKAEYFVESLGTALSGRVTVESRKVQGWQGLPLYSLATLRALTSFRAKEMMLTMDGVTIESTTLLLSVLNGMREGNFQLAPSANMADGQLNLVHGKRISTWQVLLLLPRVALFGLPRHHREIDCRLCSDIEIQTDWELTIHTDGEIVAMPGDGVHHARIRILPQRLRVALWNTTLKGRSR